MGENGPHRGDFFPHTDTEIFSSLEEAQQEFQSSRALWLPLPDYSLVSHTRISETWDAHPSVDHLYTPIANNEGTRAAMNCQTLSRRCHARSNIILVSSRTPFASKHAKRSCSPEIMECNMRFPLLFHEIVNKACSWQQLLSRGFKHTIR